VSIVILIIGLLTIKNIFNNPPKIIENKVTKIAEEKAILQKKFPTHFHADHFADLGEVIDRSFVMQRRNELEVYGPTGTKQIVEGFMSAYESEYKSRTAHHGEKMMPPEFAGAIPIEFDDQLDEVVVYENYGVKVTAFKGNHPPVKQKK
jgi:ribonuclease Z